MNLNVNYNNLNDIGNFVLEYEDKLNSCLDEITKVIPEISVAWTGDDSKIFTTKLNNYIKKRQIENDEIKVIGDLVIKCSGAYRERDIEWKNNMKIRSDRLG